MINIKCKRNRTSRALVCNILVTALCWVLLSSETSAQQKCYVDLIVAYTPEASQEAGGDSIIVNQIEQAVLQMNEAFVNSNVNHWVRLVRTVRVNYNESGCFVTDLNAFWQGTDSSLAFVHTLRERYHADLAALIITNNQFCGLPALDSLAATFSTAYCAVQYNCMVQNYSLAHMLGHLYGCGHAKYELDPPEEGVAFPYGHGYHWEYDEIANFYTIMGITDDVNCYGQGAYDCNMINYFSNPQISYQGVPVGNEYSNNAKVINEQVNVVGNFYRLPDEYVIADSVYTSDLAVELALDSLISGKRYIGEDKANIYFRAGKTIVLQPGFTMNEGTYFEAYIDNSLQNCPSTFK